jgi:uncharacterized membrane protein YphA (DoxX/SURF4 family)
VSRRVVAGPAALFLLSGATKLGGVRRSLEMRDHIGVGPATWRAIGATEVGAVAGLLLGRRYRPMARAGSACLTVISLGAIASHVRIGDPPPRAMPAVGALALCVPALVASFHG